MTKPSIDDPSKAEAIAAYLVDKSFSADQVRKVLALEDEDWDTTSFWQIAAAEAGVNFPSRKARERVAELLSAMETANA